MNVVATYQGGDSTKFQKIDGQSNVQLIRTSVLKENKRTYSVTTTKQQKKKNTKNALKLSFNLF